MRSKKGFTGIELIIFVGIIGLVASFAAPSIGKAVNSVFTGTKNQQKQVHKVTEQYSMFYKDDKGNYKPAPVPYKRTEDSLNYINTEPPETLWQKFIKLGAMAVVIIIVLSYLGLWPIITLWWNKKVKPKIEKTQAELEAVQREKGCLSEEAKRIVLSVDGGLASIDDAIKRANIVLDASTDQVSKATQLAIVKVLEQVKFDFLDAMSRKQDASTKNLVKELLKND
ncbi:MAG: type II secretion system protein [Candidatus Omnitrophota bacterium]|jgi:hypothetical protein